MLFKEYNQDQPFLLPLSLHDFLPEDHLARVINAVVNELALGELYDRYCDVGCSAYHPQGMLKVLFYAYATGERSSRVISHRVRSDVAYMYLAALQRPDFRTINRFRKDNVDILKGLFVQIVRLCAEMESIHKGTCKHPEFHKSRFTYNEGSDTYTCPMERTVSFRGFLKREGKPDIRIYRCIDCTNCERKKECTKARQRVISCDPREFLNFYFYRFIDY